MKIFSRSFLPQWLTFFFAVIPATVLLFFIGFGLMISLQGMFSGDPIVALLFLWCLAGLAGTAALWAVLLQQRKPWVAFGLVVGLLAILPISFGFAGSIPDVREPTEVAMAIWSISLPLTAVYWLARGKWDASRSLSLDPYRNASHSNWDQS